MPCLRPPRKQFYRYVSKNKETTLDWLQQKVVATATELGSCNKKEKRVVLSDVFM